VQQTGGDEDLRTAGVAQQPGDLQRMVDERLSVVAPLAGVTSNGECERPWRERIGWGGHFSPSAPVSGPVAVPVTIASGVFRHPHHI
jgi:hypothetical protein